MITTSVKASLTAAGNQAVDVCASVPKLVGGDVHLVIQSKHTTTDKTVSAQVISDWYEEVSKATATRRSDQDDVLYVFFTNKRLSDPAVQALDAHFFRERPFLCVITADQLEAVIPPCLRLHVLSSRPSVGSGDSAS